MSLEIWDKLRTPPPWALKTIGAGRLKNMTDVSPMWRIQAMTEVFGPCGTAWKYEIKRLWAEPGADGQVLAFAEILLYYWVNQTNDWSAGIPGIGGSMMVVKEKNGLHTSDESYKMATTDALSVAMKCLGVAADIYAGKWDGSKYKDAAPPETPPVDENTKRAISEWKQNIDTLAETAPLATIKAYWATNKAAIIKDCGQGQAAEVYQHLVAVANRVAMAEGAV